MAEDKKLDQNEQEEMNLDQRKDTLADQWTNGWRDNPILGRVVGFAGGAIAVAFHLLHVAISHLFFDSNERLDLIGVFNRSMAKARNSDRNSDGAPEKSESTSNTDAKKSEASKENTVNTKGNEEAEKISPDIRDKAVNQLFNSKEVKDIFRNIGLEAIPQQGSDNIVLFQKETINHAECQRKVCAMSKDELLKGNADSLATAIFQYQIGKNRFSSENDILTAKAEAALRAASVVAAINYQGNKEEFDKAILNNDVLKLSTVQIEDKLGASTITMESSSQYKNMIDIKVNGEVVSNIGIDALSNSESSNAVIEYLKTQNEPKEFTIGSQDKLKFTPTEKGMKVMCIERPDIKLSTGEIIAKQKNVNLGTYRFDSEKDIERLHQAMAKNKIVTVFDLPNGDRKTVDMASLAYTVGVLNNPDIRPYSNRDGEYLSPMDGKFQKDGAAHLFTEHTENGVALKMFYPQKGASLSDIMICQYRHLNDLKDKNIIQITEAVKEAYGKCQENEYIKADYKREEHEFDSYGTKFEKPTIVNENEIKEVINDSKLDSILQGEEPIFKENDTIAMEEHYIDPEEQTYDEAICEVLNEEQVMDLTPENLEKLQAEVEMRQDEFDFYDDDYR